MSEYATIDISIANQVATITILTRPRQLAAGADNHTEMAAAFTELRANDDVRVIVLTGSGTQFKVPPPRDYYEGANHANPLADPTRAWSTFSALIRLHQTMAEIEKPIVCRLNGNAIGFGQSLVFASDIVVACDDALLMDHHMGGTFTGQYADGPHEGGHDFSSVPGDGGLALVPLHLSPLKAKEYLMLAEPIEARQLAAWGIINYAVPREQLDSKVEEILQKLLRRGAYPLAWTKRVVNRRVAEHLNMTLDAGIAYEMLSFIQRDATGGQDKKTLG